MGAECSCVRAGSSFIALLNKSKQRLQSVIKNKYASVHKGTVGHLKVFNSKYEKQMPDNINSFLCLKFGLTIVISHSILRTQIQLILTSATTTASTAILSRNGIANLLPRSIGHPTDHYISGLFTGSSLWNCHK